MAYLIEITEEDNIVSETGNSMSSWHFDNKSEDIVDKGVERFIHKYIPRKMSHRFSESFLNRNIQANINFKIQI